MIANFSTMNASAQNRFVIEDSNDLFEPDNVLRRVLHAAGIPYSEAPVGHMPRFYVGTERIGLVSFHSLQNPALRSTADTVAPRCFDGVSIEYNAYVTNSHGGDEDPRCSKDVRLAREEREGGSVDVIDLAAVHSGYVHAMMSSCSFTARCNAENNREDPSRTPELSHASAIRSDAEQRAIPVMLKSLETIMEKARDAEKGFYNLLDPKETAKLAREGYTAATVGPKHSKYELPAKSIADVPPGMPSLDTSSGDGAEIGRIAAIAKSMEQVQGISR